MNPSIHEEADLWAATAATGDLTDAEAAAWNEHIATCAECRKLNTGQLALGALIRDKLEADAPDGGFEQRILDGVARARTGVTRRRRSPVNLSSILAAAACVAFIAVAGVGSYIFFRQSASPDIAATTPAQPDLSKLPAPVRAAIQSHAKGQTVTNIQTDDDNGDISYIVDAKGTDGTTESSFTVASDGTLLSISLDISAAPGPVRAAIADHAAQGIVDGVEEDFDEAQPTYVATITTLEGRDHDFTFASDGTLLDVETQLDELSPALQTAIGQAVAEQPYSGTLESVDKTFDDGQESYVATIEDSTGHNRDYTFNPDGSLSSIEQSLADLPASIQAAINAQVGGDKLQSIDKSFDDGAITYDATVTDSNGHDRDFSISDKGALISREVSMDDAPIAVQHTINQTVGAGRVIEVDQAFDVSGGGIPYEIEGWKDGKPFYFLVSPAGSFLGVEN